MAQLMPLQMLRSIRKECGMDSKDYRNAMKQQAGAVAVIATGVNGERTGMTATAVCSLSDDPPMLLVCVNKSASAHVLIKNTGTFSVNFLSMQQEDVAACFAGMTGLKAEARFAYGAWTTLETGAPVLGDTLASFDCELINEHQYSTHSIFIGAVKSVRSAPEADSLLYFRGKFTGVAEAAGTPV
jgi:flavin reductase (DIM6/NTAB) family NADH-FMN oxidoreductase RutF